MTGCSGFEHRQGFGTAHFAKDDQIRTLAERQSDTTGKTAAAAQHFHGHSVRRQRQFARVFDEDCALLGGNCLEQRRCESGLAAARAAGDQKRNTAPNGFEQQFGGFAWQDARLLLCKIVDCSPARGKRAHSDRRASGVYGGRVTANRSRRSAVP